MVKAILLVGAISTLAFSLSESVVEDEIRDVNKSVESFVRSVVFQKTEGLVTVDKVEIVEVLTLEETDSFEGYRLKIKTSAKDPETDKNISQSFEDIIFVSDEGMIVPKLYTDKGKDVSKKYFDAINKKFEALENKNLTKFETKEYLYLPNTLSGERTKGLKNLVFISDPLCPLCRDYFESITKKAKGKYNLYIVDFPLDRIHPASKYMLAARNQILRKNHIDVLKNMYMEKKYTTLRELLTEEDIISFLEKNLSYKIDRKELREIDLPKAMNPYEISESMGIKKRTPAIYVDGKGTQIVNL